MIQVYIKSKQYLIPEKLDECSRGQLITYLELFVVWQEELYINTGEKVTIKDRELYNTCLQTLLFRLLNIRWRLFRLIPGSERQRLLSEEKLLDFFFTDILTINKIESVGFFAKYHGPTRMFHQITFDEFRHSYAQYKEYVETQNPDALHWMMAILYRPKRKDKAEVGDIREPLNIYTVEKRLKVMKKQPLSTKLAVYKYFAGNMVLLQQQFPLPFAAPEKTDTKDHEGDFLDIALSISGEAKETLQSLLQENVYLAFKRINTLIQKAKDLEKTINDRK
ncbi:hypothetical protein QQ054_32185 [Oscillatoria amoena NRMC-F 0135]|nr:hypothetical protein [Oscillatoria amoena NRMC-F 0135]